MSNQEQNKPQETQNQAATQEPQQQEESKKQNSTYDQPEIDNSERSNGAKIGFVALLVLLILLIVGLSMISSRRDKSGEESVKKELENIKTEVRNKVFTAPKDDPLNADEPEIEPEKSGFSNEPDWQKEKRRKAILESGGKENPLGQTKKRNFKPKVFRSATSAFVETNGKKQEQEISTDTNITWEQQRKLLEDEREFEGDIFIAKNASKMKFNPSLLLQKGTYISCSLDTRLVSQIAGQLSCTVSENVYSKDGVTLLIEKGSRIFGSFKSGEMNDGMNRIFVAWSEIRTPNNITIPVQSGAIDRLGGSGMEGYVNHQWMKRFGASILLSLIDDIANYAANGKRSENNNNSTDYTQNSRDNTQEMANTALEEFIKIKPVLYINQGDLVGVYVNRDIDFSKVYKLKVGRKK